MLRVLLLLFLILPMMSNAAGIYDTNNSETSLLELRDIYTTQHNQNLPTYKSELSSILRKNTLLQRIQDKKTTTHYILADEKTSFIQDIANQDMDSQVLLETLTTWKELKDKLDYLNILFNKIDIWAENFLDENLDGNLIFIFETQNTRSAKTQGVHTQHQNNFFYRDSTEKFQQLHNKNSLNNKGQQQDYDKKDIFSLFYLWEKYDTYIIGLGVIFTLWTAAKSLIYAMNRPER